MIRVHVYLGAGTSSFTTSKPNPLTNALNTNLTIRTCDLREDAHDGTDKMKEPHLCNYYFFIIGGSVDFCWVEKCQKKTVRPGGAEGERACVVL